MRNKLIAAGFVAAVLLLVYFVRPVSSTSTASRSAAGAVAEAAAQDDKSGPHPDSDASARPTGDPYAPMKSGESALTHAARTGNLARIRAFLRRNPTVNFSRPDANGDNALVAAVAGGQLKLAEKFIKAGVIVDRAAFLRLSKTLTADDKAKIQWWLRKHLPFADPQILHGFYDPTDQYSIDDVLGAGYRPTRKEAAAMSKQSLNMRSYLRLVRLYPGLIAPARRKELVGYIDFKDSSPQERMLADALFATIPDPGGNLSDYLHTLPFDLIATHPDFKHFDHYTLSTYCETDNEGTVALLNEGMRCAAKFPFGEAADSNNYALVQRYVDLGTDPKAARTYGRSVMDDALHNPDAKKLEMAKLLLDNGAATGEQRTRFYRELRDFGNRFDRYLTRGYRPLKLAASPADDLYVLAYADDERRYHLTRQDANGKVRWDHAFRDTRYYNVLDNPAGLYFDDGRILLAQNRDFDGVRKTRLSLFGSDGTLLHRYDAKGVFQALVLQKDGYALTTGRSTVFLDKRLTPVGDIAKMPEAFHPAVPMAAMKIHSRDLQFYYDLQKADFYPGRTLVLYRPKHDDPLFHRPARIVSRYVALVVSKDGETSTRALVGGGDVTPLDFAVSNTHAYIIEAANGRAVIQKRSVDFGVKSFHYVSFGRAPVRTTIDSMACDAVGCSLVGRDGDRLALVRTVPGSKHQTLSTTDVAYRKRDGEGTDPPHWVVSRDGTHDLVFGPRQFRFDGGRLVDTTQTMRLESPLGRMPGSDGEVFLFGGHGGDAAYEELARDGSLKGHHEYDFGYVHSEITAMRRLPDGRLLAVGNIYHYYHFFRTFAMLLSPDGTPAWSRVYRRVPMSGLLLDPDNALFYTVGRGESVLKLSLKDGAIVKKLRAVKGLETLYRAADGRIVGIGRGSITYGKHKGDKTTQPFAYCLDKGDATFSAHTLGNPGDEVAAAAPWGDGLVVAYVMARNGSTRSNAVLARLDAKTCNISFDGNQ